MAAKNTNRDDQPPAYGEQPQAPRPTVLKASRHIISQARKWSIINSNRDLFLPKVNTRLPMVNIRKANIRKASTRKASIRKASIRKAITEEPDNPTRDGAPTAPPAVCSEVWLLQLPRQTPFA
ncbi:hypothetical protein Trco_003870 [Trichoderma cornu-damae]|uniref:Uncharacterized protein n=1 Tax=Trichoderma cornu-damae TaxID=654480 RepID=A0A9P8QS65_9HYPO|nr:hypothetical protein Trco_003870 [Trichoderma cornu-damae]